MARTVLDPPGGYPPAPQPGHPQPGQPGFQASAGGYPPGGGYPGGYPPAGYPPGQGGYPPGQGGYPPGQGGFPPGYPPPGHPQGGYSPGGQGGYPPGGQGGYPPGGQGGYPPPGGGYPPGGAGPQGAGRKGGPRRALAIVGASVGGVALLVVIVYFAVFHYTPVALRHVPAGTTVAMRVDLVDAATFGPVRRNLTPLADEATPGAAAVAGGKSRTERVGDAVGFTPERDIRELVVCFLGGDDRVVVLVGGNIPKDRLVPGLKKVIDDEKSAGWTLAGDVLRASNMVVGQASDGTAIVASDEAALRAAQGESSLGEQMGLTSEASVSYAVAGDIWQKLSAGTYGSMLTSLQNLRSLGPASGTMTLGNNPRLETRVRLASGASAEEAKAALYRVFTDLRRLSELRRKITGSSLDLAGEEQALAQSTIETRGADVLRVVTPWPYDGLDRGSRELATKLRALRAGVNAAAIPAVQPPGNLVLPGGVPLPLPIPGFQ